MKRPLARRSRVKPLAVGRSHFNVAEARLRPNGLRRGEGGPDGIRTRVPGMKILCPRPG